MKLPSDYNSRYINVVYYIDSPKTEILATYLIFIVQLKN